MFLKVIAVMLCASAVAYSGPSRLQPSPKTTAFIFVTAGQDHTCGLTKDGAAYCWGSNSDGQLGIGAKDELKHSRPVRSATALKLKLITAGHRHMCGLTERGSAFCWGANDFGQLGNGSLTSSGAPVAVAGKLAFKSLNAGATHTCGIAVSGAAYCWGGNWHGQLGMGTRDGEQKYPCCHTVPVTIGGGVAFSQFSAGGIHTCGLTQDGKAYCWGAGTSGRLGTGAAGEVDISAPTAVTGALVFTVVRARGFHSCGIAASGIAYCWGEGSEGQLGLGPADVSQAAPTAVAGKLRFSAIEVGGNHTCALTVGRRIYCWGSNRFGQLGSGGNENRYSPAPVSTERQFKLITAGGNDFSGHTCAVATDGKTLCWGDNRWGQLGNGSTAGSSHPVAVAAPSGSGLNRVTKK